MIVQLCHVVDLVEVEAEPFSLFDQLSSFEQSINVLLELDVLLLSKFLAFTIGVKRFVICTVVDHDSMTLIFKLDQFFEQLQLLDHVVLSFAALLVPLCGLLG